jgi:PAS domain-containing protein
MNDPQVRASKSRRSKTGAAGLQEVVVAHLEREEQKTIGQLIYLIDLRQRIAALNPSETERRAIETDLDGSCQRLEHLLAAGPAIIYATQIAGSYACTFVTDNLRSIMGYAPQEMTTDLKHWPAWKQDRQMGRRRAPCTRELRELVSGSEPTG